MLEIGSLVDGKYKILSKIGSGGMSVVYMAINEKANKTWAVKELRREGVVNYEAVRNGLIAETEILKKLNHPYLPSIVDVIEDEDSILIVMDYVEGVSMNKILDERGPLPQEDVIKWGKQLCDVFAYLHSRKPPIIYRDMKPGNIMLKPNGDITLIDFGTAREYKEYNHEDTTLLGTIGYAAPEQFGGAGQTDARTDIYGLGATLYHLVTGMNPSEPPYEIRPIREINPQLSGGLEKIILKCVQKNPDDRYQSADELAVALSNYEKFDESYRAGLKRKLAAFLLVLFLAVGFSIAGVISQSMAMSDAAENYKEKVEAAALSVNYETKISMLEDAVRLPGQGAEPEAYLELIRSYKENDNLFSMKEAQQIERLISENRSELLKSYNQDNYLQICFELGKLFWYYYDYGDIDNNQLTRAKASVPWFQEVLTYAPEDYEHLNMAKVYSNIGIFYRDITTAVTEADDKGIYAPFFRDLQTMMQEIGGDENESEMIRLQLLELGRSAIQQYASKLKQDGVPEADMMNMLQSIEENLESIQTNTEKTDQIRQESLQHMAPTRQAVRTAFSTKGGTS